ncbi:hypothetical protein [Pseudomonas uvaldensis]|uniref:hypothetical protein n=1 Tax=Pseudomonas uvaldensis TaxID=2878385 RepID=UPI001E34DE55|nr:hypothetical protein [Pseudomonas uvaldensis]MCE0459957.1 hypothetical protein [Pseudomonas uvaldensis]
MSKVRTAAERSTTEAPTTIGPARTFRDTRFTSRTLIMPDGSPLPVIAGNVIACTDEQYAFLKVHPDLQPLTE